MSAPLAPVPLIESLYRKRICDNKERAASVQRDVAFLLANFNQKTDAVTRVVTRLRELFLDAVGVEHADDRAYVRTMVGMMPTSWALGVPPELAMSPSPDDTRIAFVIGKPLRKAGAACLEIMHVVCLRVVNRSSVHLSSVIDRSTRRIVKEAGPADKPGLPQQEAARVSLPGNCCTALSEAGADVVDKSIARCTKMADAVRQVTFESFDMAMDALVGALGRNSLAAPELKRMHSACPNECPVPTRVDSVAVSKCVAGMKRKLGA